MKSFRKLIALLLMLWTPVFFSGAAYAATKMVLTSAVTHEAAQEPHSCHHTQSEYSHSNQDIKHPAGDAHCQHCSFCLGFAAPINEIATRIVPQLTPLAYHATWASSTHNITPDHRPPIDA